MRSLSLLGMNWTGTQSDTRPTALLAGVMAASVALGYGAAHWPWIITGAFFGVLVLWISLTAPLVLISVNLALGALDLSPATGGFKALFTEVGGLDMNGIRLVAMSCGLMAVVATDRSVQAHVFGKPGRWYAIFLIWITLGLVTSYSPLDGLRLLLKLAYPLLTFAVVAAMTSSTRQLQQLMNLTLGSAAAVVLVINPLFVLAGGYQVDDQGFLRVPGLGTHANPFSFYLCVLLFISFARFLTRGQWRYIGLCGFLGFWMVLTLTRITLLACFSGLAVMMLFVAFEGRARRAVIAGALLGAGIGIPFVPAVLQRTFGYVPSLGDLLSLARSPLLLYERMNWQGRDILWAILWDAFTANPWTGYGLGSSTVIIRANFRAVAAQVAHNEYLRLAVEAGIIGVALLFIANVLWLARTAAIGWRAHPRVLEFALPGVAAIIAWAIISITDNSFDYYAAFTQYVGFLCGGAIAAKRLYANAAPSVPARIGAVPSATPG